MQIDKKLTRLVKRKSIDLSGVSKTDQSYKKSCDINVIMRNVQKTGVMPNTHRQGFYADVSELPTLEASFNMVKQAQEAFLSLPSDIRKLMDHDPSNLTNFVANSDNQEICIKHGLLIKKTETTDHVAQPKGEQHESKEDTTV